MDKIGGKKTYDDYVLAKNVIKKESKQKEFYEDMGKIVPTESGISVSKFLNTRFNDIINVDFTSHMEEDLDKIAEGNKTYHNLISKFYSFITKKCEVPAKEKGAKKHILESYKQNMSVNGTSVLSGSLATDR